MASEKPGKTLTTLDLPDGVNGQILYAKPLLHLKCDYIVQA